MLRSKLVALAVALLSAVGVISANQQYIRIRKVASTSGSLSLVEMSDLTWNGMYRLSNSGSAGTTEGGTFYSYGTLAVRYTNSTPSSGTCADTRRLLIPNFSNAQTPRTWGDLVEYCVPSSSSYYTGASPQSSTALLEVRRWAGSEWTAPMNSLGDSASGNMVGGLWWDEAQQVLYVNVYGYYHSYNMQSHLAVTLGDATHGTLGGNYKTVGTIYGPWYYRETALGSNGENIDWKQVNHGFMPIPASAQSDFGGRDLMLIGAVGAVAGAGHIGIGLRAVAKPSLALAANSILAAADSAGVGLRIADYSSEFGGAPYPAMHRPTNYTVKEYTDHMRSDTGLYPAGACGTPASGPDGCWQMSMDQINGAIWVETTNVHGLLSFGREVYGGTGYGYVPLSRYPRPVTSLTSSGTTASATVSNHKFNTGATVTISCVSPAGYNGTYTVTVTGINTFTYQTVGSDLGASSAAGSGNTSNGQACTLYGYRVAIGWDATVQADHSDQGRPVGDANGYSGEFYTGAVRRLDPAHVRAVARGEKSSTNSETNWENIGDWYTQAGWDIPPFSRLDPGASNTRINQLSQNTHGMFWDAIAKQIIWVQAESAANSLGSGGPPTIQFFTVR